MTENLQTTPSNDEGKQDSIAQAKDNSETLNTGQENQPKTEAKIEEKVENKTWQEEWAANDEKALKRLQRFKDPKDIFKSYIDLEKKYSETRPKFQLPENPTEEDYKKYREENGVPEKPEDYDLNLSNGLVIGENDKSIIDKFTKVAHSKNLPNDLLKKSIESYFEARQQEELETTKFLEKTQLDANEKLKEQWGEKFNENKTKVANFLQSKLGEEEALLLDGAILPDGTRIATNPNLLNKLLNLADVFYQSPSDFPDNNQFNSINKEISEIEKSIREDRDGYFRDPDKQKRYAELLEMRKKQS